MAHDIREYLIERFRGDAETLRQRATAIAGATKPAPGPDATLSRAMADACDEVAALAEGLPVRASMEEIIPALQALLPQLSTRAMSPQAQQAPALKAVYMGASTRVQELIAAELRASGASDGSNTDPAFANDADFDEDDE
ncbi:MAG: hypothetical protein H7Z40_15625 [Phycisphaerae bacterium]|nr:hypothetical protein [Gemmatimonadaceae bacterium]